MSNSSSEIPEFTLNPMQPMLTLGTPDFRAIGIAAHVGRPNAEMPLPVQLTESDASANNIAWLGRAKNRTTSESIGI
jgi:hypothetical protein